MLWYGYILWSDLGKGFGCYQKANWFKTVEVNVQVLGGEVITGGVLHRIDSIRHAKEKLDSEHTFSFYPDHTFRFPSRSHLQFSSRAHL